MLPRAGRRKYQLTVTPNLIKPFTIAGFLIGELYMVFTVLGPDKSGAAVPWDGVLGRLFGAAFFFGPFGAAVGMGVGLLAMLAINLLGRARRRLPRQ